MPPGFVPPVPGLPATEPPRVVPGLPGLPTGSGPALVPSGAPVVASVLPKTGQALARELPVAELGDMAPLVGLLTRMAGTARATL